MRSSRLFGRSALKVLAVIVWLTFTVALASWWMIFGLRQIDAISHLSGLGSDVLLHKHRMLVYEGSFLILLLLGGGLALLGAIFIERRRSAQIQRFFAAFTHDLKTSLASLRLQAESLEEDLKDSAHSKLLQRLVKDQRRLEVQLENSLFVANPETAKLYLETRKLSQMVASVALMWGDLKVTLQGDGDLSVDVRAFESVLKNTFQNAIVHGRASEIIITVAAVGNDHVGVRIHDNGRGFQGDTKKLGQAFYRHNTTSGSGLGLYIARTMVERLGGKMEILPQASGFATEIVLKGRVA